MDDKLTSWSQSEDARFRELVEKGASLGEIEAVLKKTQRQLRQRGYDLGLPLKWFRRIAS